MGIEINSKQKRIENCRIKLVEKIEVTTREIGLGFVDNLLDVF
jgi:hypothetical protein